MTETTSDSEDFDDYTDAHRRKAPPDAEKVRRAHTPDVADGPDSEPPD